MRANTSTTRNMAKALSNGLTDANTRASGKMGVRKVSAYTLTGKARRSLADGKTPSAPLGLVRMNTSKVKMAEFHNFQGQEE